jgi:hypothetical protein
MGAQVGTTPEVLAAAAVDACAGGGGASDTS